jgi:hypothetical protein
MRNNPVGVAQIVFLNRGEAVRSERKGHSQLTPVYYYSQGRLLESLAHGGAFGYLPNLRLRKSGKEL